MIQASLAFPQVSSTCYTVQGAYTTPQMNPGLQALLFCWHQEASLPTEHGGPALPNVPDSKRALIPHQRARMQDSSLREGKPYNLLLYRWHQKACVPKVHTALPCRRVLSLLFKSWNPSSSIEWASAALQVLGGLPPPCTETQHSPLWLQESPCTPIKEWELQPPHWGEKRGNLHHNENPAKGSISSILLSEEHC
jgi:hypothetical protein